MRRVKSKVQEKSTIGCYVESLLNDKQFLNKCRTLTERENGIVKLIWMGYRMNEISRMLKISQRTVEFHRYNIMKKYRVDNTVQMLRIALAKKIIELTKAELGYE